MNTIKHIFLRYSAFLWGLLKPLGAWGVFVIAALDGAALGLPMDPIVATYVYQDRSRFLLYVLMASTGSALGSIVIYGIGYWAAKDCCASAFRRSALTSFTRLSKSIPSGA